MSSLVTTRVLILQVRNLLTSGTGNCDELVLGDEHADRLFIFHLNQLLRRLLYEYFGGNIDRASNCQCT